MKYRLKIADVIEFPVEMTLRNGAELETHKFFVTAKRISALEDADLTNPDSSKGDVLIADFLREKVVGWRDQDLVVGEDDKPSEFNADAMAAMLSLPAAENVIFAAYLREIRVSLSPEGRRKN